MNVDHSEIKTMNIRVADDSDSAAWNDYVDSLPGHTYGHRWQWRDILRESFGVVPYYFLAETDGRIVGVLPTVFMKSMLFGKFLVSLPWLDYGGPLTDNPRISSLLVDKASSLAREKNCRFFEMRAIRDRLEGLVEKTDKFSFFLDLTKGEEAVWKSFNAKARNQVRKAVKLGLTAEVGGAELINNFYRIFSYNMRDLGTPVWPKSLFTEIFRRFGRDANIALVKLDNNPIAAGLIIHYRNYSGVPSASAYRKYINLCPNNLLYWAIIKYCIERGSRTFDFGRSSLGSGTYHFKKQWVKDPEKQIWQYHLYGIENLPELNPNNPKFKTAIAVWRRLPLILTNFLGPRIVTKIP